ncbi:MAG: hypothetical protein HY540_07120 [Deltaproteobacteria bacterium]|nr:hypothetical protein [Deltaproteobacteria bacterium]
MDLSENPGGAPLIVSPSLATGLFDFTPPVSLRGRQKIVITDASTGESISRTVTVVHVGDRPGFRFLPAGQVGPVTSVGDESGGRREHHFPLVVHTLVHSSKEGQP